MLNCKLHWPLAVVLACWSVGCSEEGGGARRPGLGGPFDAAIPGGDAGFGTDAGDGDGDDDGGSDASDAGSDGDAGEVQPPEDLLEPDTMLTKPTVPSQEAALLPGASTQVPTDCSEDEVPCNGSCLEQGQEQDGCRVLLLDNDVGFESLLVDADHVYFGRFKPIHRLPIAGGAPELLSDDVFNPRLHGIREGKLLFSGRQSIAYELRTLHEVPASGGDVGQLFTGTFFEWVVLVAERAYFVTYASQAQQRFQQVQLQASPGAPLERLFSVGQVQGFDVDGEWVVAGFRDDMDRDWLALALADGSGSAAMLEDPDLRTEDVFLEGGNAYWFGENYIGRVATGASETEAIVRFPFTQPRLEAHDTAHIYLTAEGAGVVYQMPLAGGDLTPVATFEDGWNPHVQVHDGKLYVAISEGVDGVYDRRAIVEITLP
jgi:hypothetical protein